jgi:serine/threonine protein kinase
LPLSPLSRLGFYEIIAPIGSGGMGEVYRAKDTRLGREVALKILTVGKSGNEERKQRFIQEAQSASSLHHPNIITIFDVGSENGLDYIAMEYVKGKQLEELIPRTGFRLNEVLKYGIQIADALANAHAAGIVHRDLKPANIMITEDGQVKLLDFGLAKLTENSIITDMDATVTKVSAGLTVEGTILGTVSYMSPEQAEGKRVDARSDIFSFGSILYEMLTGRKAFQSGTMVSTLSAILRDDPEPVGIIPEDNRGELERIISRCLRKDPERRWNNMSDLKTALQDLREESVSGSSVSARIAPNRVPPQSPKTGWVLGAGMLLVAGAAAWFTMGEKASYPLSPPTPPAAANEPPVVKPSAFPPTPEVPLTNDQVIQLVKSGIKKSLIVSQIRNSKSNFSLTTPELIRLANEGVPEDVIEVMRNPGAAGTSLPAPGDPSETPPVTPPKQLYATLKTGQDMPLLAASDVLFSAEDGSKVDFTVADDVKVDDRVVIAKGAPATGTLVDTEKRKLFGRGGKVTIRLESVKAVDGQIIKLRAEPVTAPASKSKIKEVAVAKDSPFTGYVGQDSAVAIGPSQK